MANARHHSNRVPEISAAAPSAPPATATAASTHTSWREAVGTALAVVPGRRRRNPLDPVSAPVPSEPVVTTPGEEPSDELAQPEVIAGD